MARLLLGMWLLLIVSLSSMFFLMGDFLSDRKHAEVATPARTPHAPVPPNVTGQDSVGLATIEELPAAARAEHPVEEEPAPPQLSDEDLEASPAALLAPNKEGAQKRREASTPTLSERPGSYRKRMKERGALERRRLGGRFGKRRLFR